MFRDSANFILFLGGSRFRLLAFLARQYLFNSMSMIALFKFLLCSFLEVGPQAAAENLCHDLDGFSTSCTST